MRVGVSASKDFLSLWCRARSGRYEKPSRIPAEYVFNLTHKVPLGTFPDVNKMNALLHRYTLISTGSFPVLFIFEVSTFRGGVLGWCLFFANIDFRVFVFRANDSFQGVAVAAIDDS